MRGNKAEKSKRLTGKEKRKVMNAEKENRQRSVKRNAMPVKKNTENETKDVDFKKNMQRRIWHQEYIRVRDEGKYKNEEEGTKKKTAIKTSSTEEQSLSCV